MEGLDGSSVISVISLFSAIKIFLVQFSAIVETKAMIFANMGLAVQ